MERYTGYPVAGSGPNAHETGPANAYGHGNAQRGDLTRPQDASFANSKATPSHNARPTKRENVGSARTEAKKERRKGKGKPGGHRGGNRGKPQTPNLRAHQKGGDRWAFNSMKHPN